MTFVVNLVNRVNVNRTTRIYYMYIYYVFTNEVCKRRFDVPQFITEVSQRILRNSGKIAEHRSVVCTPRS
uniref:Uncharacterized protein n=1 Tax=Caenorhabditis japonica TaxID=281687 RepID=A0A8R1E5N4_CAEJA